MTAYDRQIELYRWELAMQTRPLGRTDILLSPVIFGGWQSGKTGWVGIDDSESVKAHQAAFDAGITTFDTAEEYGKGHSEQILAKALSHKRSEIVILDKVFVDHLTYPDVLEACDRSLKNLSTDYIDLYQIHWPSGSFGTPVVPIEETMNALNDLKQAGKIRAIGVSNFNSAQIAEAAQFGRIESLQSPYSLFWIKDIQEADDYCTIHELSTLSYSPLAQGLLSGKFGPDHVFDQNDNRSRNRLFKGDHYIRAQAALEKLKPIAAKYGATLGQLAIGWVIAQTLTFAIVGARNAEQAVQNAAAADFEIDIDDIEEMSQIGLTVTDHLQDAAIMWG